MKLNRKELLALPRRSWSEPAVYKSLYLVPTGRKHDSGWSVMAIVGEYANQQMEIAAYCDDIGWDWSQVGIKVSWEGMRTDCTYPGGILHFWSYHYHFIVGPSLSSTPVTVVALPESVELKY